MKKLLLIVICCVLAGCGGAGRKSPEAPSAGAEMVRSSTGKASSAPTESLTQKILDSAYEEWVFFGQQKVVYDQDEESIPHVGVWEDDDWVHIDRVNQYWRAVGMPGLSGKDCMQPWSAAFISWVMLTAGVPESWFPPAISHWMYLSQFLAEAQNPDAVFIPHSIGEYRPKPGDLICASREENASSFASGELPSPSELEQTKLHCDIVTQSTGGILQAIGGNVRNSVSKSILTLSPEGYLQPTQRRLWFMVIENRLD